MEKKLSREELLKRLLEIAIDPFTSVEQKHDIRKIMETSTNFKGKNHLFLVQCYFNETDPLFTVTKAQALTQAKLAFKEHNLYSCYYLYLLLKDSEPVQARNFLRICCDNAFPNAYLEMAKCRHKGILFEKNDDIAFENYSKAALCGLEEGYYGMLLIASEKGDKEKTKVIYESAKKKGFILPGIVE